MTESYDIALVRVDNRLVHGQILEAWVPHLDAECIMVVDDNSAADFFCETVIRMAVPSHIEVNICSVEDFASHYSFARGKGKKTIVLFANIADALRAHELGFQFNKLNIGNINHEEYRLCCSPSVFLCDTEIDDILKLLRVKGVAVELKRVPREKGMDIKDALREFCS
ncbi:MAG TPA: PTS sugar transporter subunit IIB [Smithellaceae bacterium]|nr:PTS sugar transporter subunit IIB [Smithellaceae bacterium]HQF83591.1 PTS sugar transporter subunit IIB [Smithellaceae bacterium]HQG79575.1 PTS sugar transporter subunit IIB [Smithellaceae bacterium]